MSMSIICCTVFTVQQLLCAVLKLIKTSRGGLVHGWGVCFYGLILCLSAGSDDAVHDVDLQGVEVGEDFVALRTGVFRNVHFHPCRGAGGEKQVRASEQQRVTASHDIKHDYNGIAMII